MKLQALVNRFRSSPLFRVQHSSKTKAELALLEQVQEIQDRLAVQRAAFNLLTDLDLIESCIYQMESLEVQYNYLMKQARLMGIKHSDLITSKEVEPNEQPDRMDHYGCTRNCHGVVLQEYQTTG